MDIAVLSDIHGNYVALEKCINYAWEQKINTFLFLGDYLGELPYPQKTMNMIYTLSEQHVCHFVKGNKENYWLYYRANGEKGWKEQDSTTGSLVYTYKNLTEKDMDFFKSLPMKKNVQIQDFPAITICHGSPEKVNEKMLPDDENTQGIIERNEANLILCGHTHIQRVIAHQGKKVFNPGSVGVSLHSGGKAQFMILHGKDGEWSEEFISLDYDTSKVISELQISGLSDAAPYWCRVTEHLLQTGEISHGAVLNKAMQYCREALGECNWPDIPEVYWERAVEKMIY